MFVDVLIMEYLVSSLFWFECTDDIDHSIEVSAVSTTQAKLQLSKGSKSGNSKVTKVSEVYFVGRSIYLISISDIF